MAASESTVQPHVAQGHAAGGAQQHAAATTAVQHRPRQFLDIVGIP
jgi:hypothetical protein